MAGRVVHFEIPADDVSRAQGFYEQAIGWSMSSMPGMGYTLLGTTPTDDTGMPSEPGSINGGMFERVDDIATPVIVIDVDDIDAALTTIESSGGKTVRPREPVGTMGFAAYFTDSEGNLLGLWQTAS
ncbi:MAG: VOC family protein [Ilumatobacteraceae bacterium]